MRFQWQMTFRDLLQLFRVGILGLVEVFKDNNLLNGRQLTKKLADDRADRVAFHLLHIWQGKVE